MLKKLSKIILKLLLLTVCLIPLLIIFLNWQAKREWLHYRHELEAGGAIFDIAKLAPPPVPDDQNFAMTPLLKPLFPSDTNYAAQLLMRLKPQPAPGSKAKAEPWFGHWALARPLDLQAWETYLGTNDLQAALQKFDPELNEISLAVQRPFARFPISYDDGKKTVLPHLEVLFQLAHLYSIRANAELASGQIDKAAVNIGTILSLAESLKAEPLLNSQLMGGGIVQIGLEPFWVGCVNHQWSDAQLAVFQKQLQRFDFIGGCRNAFQSERAYTTRAFDPASTELTTPLEIVDSSTAAELFSCIFYWNTSTFNHGLEEYIFPSFQAETHRFNVKRLKTVDFWLNDLNQSIRTRVKVVYTEWMLMSIVVKTRKLMFTQTSVDEAQIVCALERYRLVHGEYPEKLEALISQFIDKLPGDVSSGNPLHYRPAPDGTFVLYSVGWNEVDDDGVIGLSDERYLEAGLDLKKGDWVWPAKFAAPDTVPTRTR